MLLPWLSVAAGQCRGVSPLRHLLRVWSSSVPWGRDTSPLHPQGLHLGAGVHVPAQSLAGRMLLLFFHFLLPFISFLHTSHESFYLSLSPFLLISSSFSLFLLLSLLLFLSSLSSQTSLLFILPSSFPLLPSSLLPLSLFLLILLLPLSLSITPPFLSSQLPLPFYLPSPLPYIPPPCPFSIPRSVASSIIKCHDPAVLGGIGVLY